MDALSVRRTESRLADGRSITYYDRPGAPPRVAIDRRSLPEVSTTSQVRWDDLLGEWVIIAGHRQERTFLPPSDSCPLCPSTQGNPTEIPEADYEVVVFDNRFPSLSDAASISDPAQAAGHRPGLGRCEVVCFTSDHGASLADVDTDRMTLVLQAWADRTREMGRDPNVEAILAFENRGVEIGVTLTHPHGQVYGYPFVPPRDQVILERARLHRERTGRSLHLDLIAREVAERERLILHTEHWVAFVPVAARWPFHLRMYPRRAVPDLSHLTADELLDAAPAYLALLRALDAVYGIRMPTISAWHQAPVRGDRTDAHAFLEVFGLRRAPDRLKYLAGSESAAGAWINDIAPEDSAAMIRAAMTDVGT